jgi:hypothetical protein
LKHEFTLEGVEEYGIAQVSMNLTNLTKHRCMPPDAWTAASKRGLRVTGSENRHAAQKCLVERANITSKTEMVEGAAEEELIATVRRWD